jgi:GMP synthase-like glutamine amidotransferase
MPSVAIIDLYGGSPNASIAAIGAHATANLADFDVFDGIGSNLPRARRFDAYIVSSGPSAPNAAEPWRVRLQAALPAYAKSRPVFAIGLGFEVMAAAYGWPVRPLKTPRDGTYPLTPTPAGWGDPLMGDLENATPVVEQRTWGVMNPPAATRTGAVVLAYSSTGDVAAARFNVNAAGSIFLPERRTTGAAATVLGHFLKQAVEAS